MPSPFVLFQIPGQGHDGRKHRQRRCLAAQDPGTQSHGLCAGICCHLGFLGGKAAFGAGNDGDL